MSEEKRQQVIALGRLGWPLRRIESEIGVRRETAAAYLKAAGVPVRQPGGWGRRAPAKPANEVSPDLGAGPDQLGASSLVPGTPVAEPADAKPANEVSSDSCPAPPPRSPTASPCEPYFDFIELSLSKGRNVKAIYQDLVDDHGFTGRYRRARMFVLTLAYSRKAVRLLTFQSSARIWAELHERAFRRLGGVTRTVVPDYVAGHITLTGTEAISGVPRLSASRPRCGGVSEGMRRRSCCGATPIRFVASHPGSVPFDNLVDAKAGQSCSRF